MSGEVSPTQGVLRSANASVSLCGLLGKDFLTLKTAGDLRNKDGAQP